MTLWCHSESGRTFEAFFTLPKRAARTTPSKDDESLSKVVFRWILSFAEAQQNIPDVCWRTNERHCLSKKKNKISASCYCK